MWVLWSWWAAMHCACRINKCVWIHFLPSQWSCLLLVHSAEWVMSLYPLPFIILSGSVGRQGQQVSRRGLHHCPPRFRMLHYESPGTSKMKQLIMNFQTWEVCSLPLYSGGEMRERLKAEFFCSLLILFNLKLFNCSLYYVLLMWTLALYQQSTIFKGILTNLSVYYFLIIFFFYIFKVTLV